MLDGSCWVTLGLLGVGLILLYKWITRDHDFWLKRGVKFTKPVPFFGSMLPTLQRKQHFNDVFQKMYHELKPHKFGGIFQFMLPTLMITDPDIIREVTVKNFDHFTDRRNITDEKSDPLINRAVSLLVGEKWKAMRSRLSPAFTTSKLRAMFPLISRCSQQFAQFLVTRKDAQTEPIEFKSSFTRLTSDVIATVAFGVECNAVKDPKSEFFTQGMKMLDFSGLRSIILFGHIMFPKLMHLLKIPLSSKKSTDFFQNIIGQTMKFREEKNVLRPDMLQLLMEAQKGGIKRALEDEQDVGTVGESEDALDMHKRHLNLDKGSKFPISDEDIAAQAFVFFLAGFDTVATVLSFLVHELAVNPDIQDRLRAEVDDALMENNQVLSYEIVQNLKYLDMVISETLRLYPPAGLTDRRCTKNFKIPGSDLLIEKDMVIIFSMYSLHRDPEYFPDPERFDPERFSEDNKKKIPPYTYLPFGSGPRNCIGMRLALLEVKIVACYLLATCQLHVSSKTQVPLKLSKTKFQMITDEGFWLKVTPRDHPSIEVEL